MTDDPGDQIGYLVLPKGTPVVTTDGVTLGTVAKVMDNAREHIFDGLVVRTASGKVFVDAPEVARIYERRVELTVDSAFDMGFDHVALCAGAGRGTTDMIMLMLRRTPMSISEATNCARMVSLGLETGT